MFRLGQAFFFKKGMGWEAVYCGAYIWVILGFKKVRNLANI